MLLMIISTSLSRCILVPSFLPHTISPPAVLSFSSFLFLRKEEERQYCTCSLMRSVVMMSTHHTHTLFLYPYTPSHTVEPGGGTLFFLSKERKEVPLCSLSFLMMKDLKTLLFSSSRRKKEVPKILPFPSEIPPVGGFGL